MKTRLLLSCLSVVSMLTALAGCANAKPTVDTQATVNYAIQATTTAQANVQATIDAAVKATTVAQATSTKVATPPPATSVVSSSAIAKTATPAPTVNATTMTEEELAALIDQAVKEAVTATSTATTTTTTYAADGTLTTQEVAAMQATVYSAQTEISQALALMNSYYGLYSELATETLNVLKAIEQDLNSMATSMNSMSQSLAQISTTLAQGLTLAQNTVTQLQSYATQANQAAANAQTKAKNMSTTLQTELNNRAKAALNVKPTSVPTDLKGTVQSLDMYITAVKSALGDSKVTQKELQAISLAGANAVSGLKQFGGAEGQKLTDAINAMTSQLARGELPKAKSGLGSLEFSAKSLPSIPSLPKVK